MDRSDRYIVIMVAWVLWQELLLPQTSRFPSWHVEGRFSEEGACQEGRNIRLIELMLRAGSDGTTIINRPTLEEGMIWRQEPNGDRTRIRFLCFPETINPEAPWFGRQRRDPSLRIADLERCGCRVGLADHRRQRATHGHAGLLVTA